MKIKEEKGQVLILFAFLIQAMFLFALVVFYLSQVSVARIRLQTAADASALSMANFQARTLNAVADRNFLLKYPSGSSEPDKVFPNYSFPGIDRCHYPEYTFSSKSIFETYMQLISPQQDFQNIAIRIYEKLIPLIGKEYINKNDYFRTPQDSPAYLVGGYVEPFDFHREEIEVRYVEWVSGPGGGVVQHREAIDAWMEGGNKLFYSEVELAKVIRIWGQDVKMNAIARAQVVSESGVVWSKDKDPKPTFRAKLVPSLKEGVLH